MNLSFIALFASGCLLAFSARADHLSLAEYLSQVKSKNKAYSAAATAAEASQLSASEAELMTSPQFNASAQTLTDEKPTANPGFQGTKTSAQMYSFGVSQMTDFGLTGKLSYGLSSAKVEGTNPAFVVPGETHYEGRPSIELSQSLLKNRFGRETEASKSAARSGAEAGRLAQLHLQKQMLVQAEMTYWRLALARKLVQTQSDSVKRAAQIRDWSQRRADLRLADRSDLLRAESAFQSRSLDLALAEEQENQASASFNSTIEREGSKVEASLDPVNQELINRLTAQGSPKMRLDVRAAEESMLASQAKVDLAQDRYTADLQLFGSYALNSREDTSSKALSKSFSSEYPTSAVGLKFAMPLGLSHIDRQRLAALKDAAAAKERYEYQQFEARTDWQELKRRLEESQARLASYKSIEEAQRLKMEHERERQKNGRSTVFQVLSDEGEYALSQLNRIRAELDILNIAAQLKIYEEN